MNKEVKELLQDWFVGRDQNAAHTVGEEANIFGWSKNVDKHYCEYWIMPVPTNKEDGLIAAAKICKSMIDSMPTRRRAYFTFNNKPVSYATNTYEIKIQIDYFDLPKMPIGRAIDTACGLAYHEALHLCYTDFDELTYMRNLCKQHGYNFQFLKHINNIIEDERIEKEGSNIFPGYNLFIGPLKEHMFGRIFDSTTETETEENEALKIFETFLKLIRFPTKVDAEIVEKHYQLFKNIKDLIQDWPTTPRQCTELSIKIYLEFAKYFDPNQEFGNEQDQESSDCQNGSGGQSVKEDREYSQEELDRLNEIINQIMDNKDLNDLLDKIDKETDVEHKNASGGNAVQFDPKNEEKLSKANEILMPDWLFKIKGRATVLGLTNIIYQTESNQTYYSIVDQMKSEIGQLSRQLNLEWINKKDHINNLKQGNIKTSKLSQLITGNQRLFRKSPRIESEKIAVVILIDESGSMCGKKINAARNSAIMLKEALDKHYGYELFIYGHSTGSGQGQGECDLYVYQEGRTKDKTVLANVKARNANIDGLAISTVAHRVREKTNRPALFFVISDGAPNGSNYIGLHAVEHTRQSVLDAEKMNMTVVQIAIEESVPSNKMFNHFVKFTNMSRLPNDISKLCRKLIPELINKKHQ